VASANPAAHASAGKFGGLFASMPQAMVSGLFAVMFGIIAVRLLSPALPQSTFAAMKHAARVLLALRLLLGLLHCAVSLLAAVAWLQAVGLSQLQYVDQNR
jgi:xanthine/uracil permease